jgi:glycosyltransferase involved in cell wall biosynthesis
MPSLRVLALTTIFPNAEMPLAAPYIRQQTAALAKLCSVSVIAPQPWFPGDHLLTRYSYWKRDFSSVPEREHIAGLLVEHPRVMRLPKATSLAAATYATSLLPTLLRRRGHFDVMLATWAYPDCVAAVALGTLLKIPVVVQVIGSDVNVVAQLPGPRAQLRLALPRAAAALAVSRPLAQKLIELGAATDRVHVVPTGLDLETFRPRDRAQARSKLGLPAQCRLITFVGRLHASKGVLELLQAFDALAPQHPELRLAIVGDGPLLGVCQEHAQRHPETLRITGELPATGVADWVAACDALTLPSHAEGTPNVILEALGSGRKVVATHVGGIPDLLGNPALGELVPPHDVAALQQELWRVVSADYDASQVADSAGLFDWNENARRVLRVLEQAATSPAN